jgi:hypothetical protein
MLSMFARSGLRPPWQQKILFSTMAATGKQLKQSVKVFHSFTLYRRLPGHLIYHTIKMEYMKYTKILISAGVRGFYLLNSIHANSGASFQPNRYQGLTSI